MRVSGNYLFPRRFVNGRGTGDGFAKIDMTVTRNDVIDLPEINNIYKDPWHPKMSTDHSYIYSFHNNSLPPRYQPNKAGIPQFSLVHQLTNFNLQV